MHSSFNASRSSASRPRRGLAAIAGRIAIGIAGSMALSTCTGDLGLASFRCTDTDPSCPNGYYCATGTCVRSGSTLPALLATTVAESDSAFSLHPRAHDLLVCWNQGLSARIPGVFSATVARTGEVTQAATSLTGSDPASISAIAGERGDCSWNGMATIAAVSRHTAGNESFRTQLYSTNAMGVSTEFGAAMLQTYSTPRLTDTLSAIVGNQTWFMVSRYLSNASNLPLGFYFISIDPDQTTHATTARIATFTTTDFLTSTELYAGMNGAWLAAILQRGETTFVWVDAMAPQLTDPHAPVLPFRAPATSGYVVAYPLAAHGNQLAVAYGFGGGRWQIRWLAPDPANDPPPGPMITLATDVVRPGGYVDGDNLLIAGVANAMDGSADATHVSIWQLPWGSSTAPTVHSTVEKLSLVPARRLQLTRVDGQLFAVWTERVPATESGATEYTALYSSPVSDTPGP